MNTFAFVGNLNDNPEVSCVYHSEEAENQFLRDPRRARLVSCACISGRASLQAEAGLALRFLIQDVAC